MKFLGFEFRRFKEEKSTVNSVEPVVIHEFEEVVTKATVVELWTVKWYPLSHDYFDSYKRKDPNHLAFTDKVAAEDYAAQLRKALKLLGDKGRDVWVERQNNPTNV